MHQIGQMHRQWDMVVLVDILHPILKLIEKFWATLWTKNIANHTQNFTNGNFKAVSISILPPDMVLIDSFLHTP